MIFYIISQSVFVQDVWYVLTYWQIFWAESKFMLYKFHVRVNVFCMELAVSLIFSLDVIRGSVGFIRKCNSTLPRAQCPPYL